LKTPLSRDEAASVGARLSTFRICVAVITPRKFSEIDSLFLMNKMWVTGP